MSWLNRERTGIKPGPKPERTEVPDGLWTKCHSCGTPIYNKDLEANLHVCPHCGHHFRLDGRTRLAQLVDPGSFTERGRELRSEDPLAFVDTKPYARRLAQAHATDPAAEVGEQPFGA